MAWIAPVLLPRFSRGVRPRIGLPIMAILFVGAAKVMVVDVPVSVIY